jgi:hypothetical protein
VLRRALSLALLGVAPAGLAAQALTVTGVQGVAFGTMLPGANTVVPRTDGSRAARFDLRGSNGRTVNLTFTLPGALSGPSGATLPLSYAAGDAGYSQSQNIGSQVAFDPRTTFNAKLSNSGRGSVFLGCTARPAGNQRAGSYSAVLTLTVVYFP